MYHQWAIKDHSMGPGRMVTWELGNLTLIYDDFPGDLLAGEEGANTSWTVSGNASLGEFFPFPLSEEQFAEVS